LEIIDWHLLTIAFEPLEPEPDDPDELEAPEELEEFEEPQAASSAATATTPTTAAIRLRLAATSRPNPFDCTRCSSPDLVVGLAQLLWFPGVL
jgi:hypothetical protein